jgi:signal transduction histidine kinase
MKFTDTGGHISVDVFRPGPVILSFRDNGSGIDKEDLPNVFERFYKGDESRNAQGSGLGLSIVKEIITLHNGSISVKSDKNSITEFIIELPGNL